MGKGAGPLFDGSQIDEDGHLAAIDEDAPLGFPSIASGENERSNKDDDASPVFKLMCARRVPVFCLLLAINACFLLLTIALAVRGLDPINLDNLGEVGIVIPTDEYQARSNAFERAEDEADFTRAGGKCARQDNANPIALTVLKGSFEDETKGNALTKKGLDTLRERERQITEAEGWGDRCALIYAEGYPDCVVAPSLAVDNGVGGTYFASDARGCMPPYSPVFLFDKYGDPDFEDAVSHYVDAETEAAILGGAHIAYYDDSAKEKEEDHLHAWVRRELLDDLVKDFADSSYPTTYSFVGDEAVSDQVGEDLKLIAASIAIVYAYMAYYTGRLAHVWHHAAGAMMVTSLTTILSFLSNLSSDFVGVVTFGVFAALLVFVNYCAVTTFMPSVVLVYESHVSKIAYPFGAARARLWAARPACLKPEDDAPKEHGHFFKASFAPFIFAHKKKLVALHVALFGVAVAFASMLEPTPFKSYTLLPEDSNFYQLNAINEEWKPLSANPLMVHVVFGLQHRDPLAWDGPDFRFVGMASGDAKTAPRRRGARLRPRRGLKIDPAYGINAQLAGSSTGSLADTPDAGASAGVQAAYGVQSLLHALRDFEDVSTAQGGGSYAAEGGVSACEPCFPTFDLSPDQRRSTAASTRHGRELDAFAARPVDRKWWEDYFYLLGRSDGTFERPALYDVQVQTTLRASEGDYAVGLRMAKKWDDWMDDHNSDPKHPLRAMVYVPGANMWVISKMLVPSGISNMLLSLFLAWLVLTHSTGNYVASSIATATIGMIATFVLGFLQIVGWGLGPWSRSSSSSSSGFRWTTRCTSRIPTCSRAAGEGKVTDALVHTGSSVLSGAISTIGASIPMFFAKIIFFYKFGIFILLTIALSLNFSLVFFSAVLAWVGPLGKTGEVAMLYASSVKRAQATIDEIEEAQQLVDDAKAAAAAPAAATETFDPDLEDDAKPVKRRKAKTSLIGPDGDVDELQY
ncbi:hypothetical protein JL720_11310 [Aureococcus anophagefferens]|nr:hypothetical protein JL720_11310 [Aureococcus anophagefferens]